MAFYDTYGDSQNRRLNQQAQNNQALQAFADFMQKQQMVKPENNLRNAQRGNFLAETQKTNLANQITQMKIKQFLSQQQMMGGGLPQVAGINVGGQTMTPQQLQANPGVWNGGQVQAQGARPIQEETEDLFGNKVITPEYQEYQKKLFDEKNSSIKNRQLEVAKEMQRMRGSEDQPMSADAAGRYAFAKQSLKNVPKIKELLFKKESDGTETFDRGLAAKMMVGKFPNDASSQNLKRMILQNATAQGLIQSGTVVKDNEWERLMQIMGIDLLSSPEAAMASINSQAEFMSDFMNAVRPSNKNNQNNYDAEKEARYQAWKAKQTGGV